MTCAVQSLLDSDTIEKVRAATRYGADASTIRQNLNLSCHCCEVDEMMEEIKNWDDWKILLCNENGSIGVQSHFYCAIFINLRVVQMEYAHDIILTDDTMCATHFNLPISVLLTVDPHDNTQMTGFGFLPGKCTSDFEFFFFKYKENIGRDIRLFILDRSLAQINGITSVYQGSDYIFCHKHISRNLEDNFGAGSDIVTKYYDFMNEKLTEDLFINYIQQKIVEFESKGLLGCKALKDLLEFREHWFPRYVNKKMHRNNLTTNRAEGFFGTFKRMIGKKPQTLAIIVRCLKILAERLMAISFLEIFQHLDLPIMLPDEGIIIGKIATEIIRDEYKRYKENIQSNEYYGFCCYTRCIYGLPCRHIIAEKAINSENGLLLAASDVNPTYYFYSHQIMQNKAVDIISDEIRKSEPIWNRTNIIAHFMSLTDEIIRCPEIKEKLLNFFSYCDSLKLSVNKDPPVHKVSGRPLQNASQFVSNSKIPRYKKNRTNVNKNKGTQRSLDRYFK